jgi:ArsR family transcriptional regulator, arsenate/arsenite/antimonite-responsive transcriptional repressor
MDTDRRTRKGELFSRFTPRLSKQVAIDQDQDWLVLRNKTRRRIMDLLSQYGGLLCVNEIAEVLEETSSTISQHLSLLRAAKLVTSEKYGSTVYYKLNQEKLTTYKQFLESL